jgi:hypothetical protein
MVAELGEGGVIGPLSDKMATIKLAPVSRNAPVRMTVKPLVTLVAPSLTNIMIEKQKALAKLNALAPQAAFLTPRTTGNAAIAAN